MDRYNQIVARPLLALCFAALACAATVRAQETEPPLPPEEDETYSAPREYAFNPLQAQKELKVAKFYMKRGSYKAASLRAQEAVKWDETLLEAYIVLGESREKTDDVDGARKAYTQYLEIAAEDAKDRKDVERRLQKLKKSDLPRAATKPPAETPAPQP